MLCTLQEGKVLPVRKVTFPSGHKYVGQIGNGTMNGLGVYAFDSNQGRYEGEVCSPLDSPTPEQAHHAHDSTSHSRTISQPPSLKRGIVRDLMRQQPPRHACKLPLVHAQFVDGVFEGLGAETFPEGLYVGSFRNGQRHGLGESLPPPETSFKAPRALPLELIGNSKLWDMIQVPTPSSL